MQSDKKKTTHFGYQNVPEEEKKERVAEVFHRVADKYDLMNDLMSGGLHRLWKRFTIEMSRVKKDARILDLAGGSGDLTHLFSKQVSSKGHIVLCDINSSMLQVGRDRLIDEGQACQIDYTQANAEHLPFRDNYFDCITIAFGLRNVTNKARALSSIYRVLRPGGKVMVLEFSKPQSSALRALYDLYSFSILPLMGKLIANDRESYQYLAESIRMHPGQEELKTLIEKAQFEDCKYHNLSGGIVALHIAYKY